jgi:hypothetical protein
MSDFLPCWPEWMPRTQHNGYGYEVTDRTLNTDMEISSLSRNEFDTDETVISCTMILRNRDELIFLETFERDCLRHGTRWFEMPIWMSGRIERYTCRFVGGLKIGGLIGVGYATVTMKLKIERRNLLDPEIMEVLMIFGPCGIESFSNLNTNLTTSLSKLSGVTNIPPEVFV